jgi:hypothetical protein
MAVPKLRRRPLIGRSERSGSDSLLGSLADVALQLTEICRASVVGSHGLARANMTKWAEQGACLDGIDGPQAPALRKEGTTEMLDGLPAVPVQAAGRR